MAKYFGIFIIMVILLCAGCNKQDNESEKNEQSTSYGETQEEMQEVTQEETQNAENYFKDADLIQDYNPNQSYGEIVTCTVQNDIMYSIVENKKDVWNSDKYIYTLDLKTGEQKPLCSKAECSHDNNKCSAYIGDANVILSNMWCIDNVIYLFGNKNTDSDFFLMRISFDGSVREEIGSGINSYGGSDNITINMHNDALIHRGYLYYVITEKGNEKKINNVVCYGNVSGKLYRYDINRKGEPECVYEYTVKDGELSIQFATQGEYIYVSPRYSMYDYSGELLNYGEFQYEEYKININTLEKEEITTGINYCSDTVRTSTLYFNRYNAAGDIVTIEMDKNQEYEIQCSTQKASVYNNETEEVKYLTDKVININEYFDPNNFWITDKYICFNVSKINGEIIGTYVFDLDWNLIKKSDEGICIDYCFGEYILWHESSGTERIYYIEKLEDYINGNNKCISPEFTQIP